MSFLKLDESLLTSTLWLDRSARDMFITAGLKAQPMEFTEPVPVYAISSTGGPIYTLPPGVYGFTECSGPGIVNLAGHNQADPKDWAEGMAALKRLTEPDLDSRDPSYEGRRLARVAGGFLVLSLMRYREKDVSPAAARKRRQRERERAARRDNATEPVTCHAPSRQERDTPVTRPLEARSPEVQKPETNERTNACSSASSQLADTLIDVCQRIATRQSISVTTAVQQVSAIPASINGAGKEGFSDPRAKGISEAWIKAALGRAQERLASLEKPLPL